MTNCYVCDKVQYRMLHVVGKWYCEEHAPNPMPKRKQGPETEKAHAKRCTLFYGYFMTGKGLDIGYKGSVSDAQPVLSTAVGVDTDYPGYDGKTLPFPDNSQNYVFTSHVLEHISDPISAIREWFRVTKVGGHVIINVPHLALYEKKLLPPSRWNEDHKRFYTPLNLLHEIETALKLNTYRIVHLRDNDDGFDYNIPPDKHSGGCYEIECVIKKIEPPKWEIV